MKTLRKIIPTNKYLATALIFLMLISSAGVLISFAKRTEKKSDTCDWYQQRTYYTDASHTTYTGMRIWFCDGYIGQAGTITAFYINSTCECDPQ
ncbi:MAG TPA: hypothetical protein VF604_04545 [Pyrinomonadaceae bacterium]|jgi:hypothetical protein